MSIKIDIYTSELCGSYPELRKSTDQALAELGIQADVNYLSVTYEEAVRRRIKGSPSIWINGKDVFESGLAPGVM
jgi:hypothetical protein